MMVLIVFVLNGKQTDFAKRHRERERHNDCLKCNTGVVVLLSLFSFLPRNEKVSLRLRASASLSLRSLPLTCLPASDLLSLLLSSPICTSPVKMGLMTPTKLLQPLQSTTSVVVERRLFCGQEVRRNGQLLLLNHLPSDRGLLDDHCCIILTNSKHIISSNVILWLVKHVATKSLQEGDLF